MANAWVITETTTRKIHVRAPRELDGDTVHANDVIDLYLDDQLDVINEYDEGTEMEADRDD